MKLLSYIWEKRKFFVTTAILLVVLFLGYSFYMTFFSQSMVISFIYPNSEKGQYPDGTRLNIYDIISDRVIADAVYEYNKASGSEDLTIQDIKSSVSVTEYVSPSLQDKIQAARSSGQDYVYFANEFYVKCAPVNRLDFKDYRHLFGLLPKADNRIFAQKLYESYLYYFMNEHTEMNIIPRMTMNINYDNYDYLEIADVFENNVSMNINYLEAKNSQNGSFVSKRTGMTFNDLIVELKGMQNLQIQNLKAFVSSSKLAKNPGEFVNKLKAENESATVEYNKLKGESEVSKTAMDQYDHTFEENIVITGIDDEMGLYQARPKTAYDTVTKRALDKGVEAQNILKDIEENNRLIEIYQSSNLTNEERQRLSAVADSMIAEIRDLNGELVEKANMTVEDFLQEKSSDYIRGKNSGRNYLSVHVLIRCVMMFCLGMVLALILALAKDFYSRSRQAYRRARAENKKQKKQLDMLASLKKGQKLSDIFGQYFDAGSDDGVSGKGDTK